MVNELRDLLRENVASPPPDHSDLGVVLRAGRRRVRRRRALVGGVAVLAVSALALAPVAWQHRPGPDIASSDVPAPRGPVLRLEQAEDAVEGRDYRVLTSYTNEDLDSDNGQYLDGVTDDGLVLFRDAPDMEDRQEHYALMDPATGEKDWLADPPRTDEQLWPVDLGEDRLLWVSATYDFSDSAGGLRGDLTAVAYDRQSGTWSRHSWPGLPQVEMPRADLGPDGRLYVLVPATQGQPPEGGWPVGPDGEAEDADADGDTYDLWSVGLGDPGDVRDEGLRLGDLAFTDDAMVWTDGTNGDPGDVHVRDLDTGEETTFDPRTGARCNLLGFGATGDRIVMSQYCGTYSGGVRDDRVQVLSTTGELVTTLQDSSVEGGVTGGLVTVTSHQRGREGTYVYDLAEDRFVRVSDSVSMWALGDGPLPDGLLMWDTATHGRKGAVQVLAEWLG